MKHRNRITVAVNTILIIEPCLLLKDENVVVVVSGAIILENYSCINNRLKMTGIVFCLKYLALLTLQVI